MIFNGQDAACHPDAEGRLRHQDRTQSGRDIQPRLYRAGMTTGSQKTFGKEIGKQ